MTEAIVIPSEDQTGLFLESPMTDTEQAALAVHETAIYTASETEERQQIAIWEEQGKHLLAIYQEGLFRGKHGGRGWAAYLVEATPRLTNDHEKGFGHDSARFRIAFYVVRQILARHEPCGTPSAGLLPRSLTQVKELASQLPRAGENNAGWNKYILDDPSKLEGVRKIWQGALLKAKEAGKDQPTTAMVAESRRSYVADPSNDARRLSPARQAQLEQIQAANQERHATPQPRAIAPEALEQARADAAAREAREATERKQAAEDAATGTINPLTLERGEGDLDAFDQCRKYHGLMIAAYNAAQSLNAFVESKARTHGADFFGFLRQVDAGSWSVASDLATMSKTRDMIQGAMDLADGSASPSDADWQSEPGMVA